MNRELRDRFSLGGRWPIELLRRPSGGRVSLSSTGGSRDLLAEILHELWLLLLLIIVIVGILAGQPWIVALAAMSIVVGLVARIWARLSLEDVSYMRGFSQDHLFPGEELELTLTVENRKPLPVPWLRLHEEVPVELEVIDQRLATDQRADTRTLKDNFSLAWYERLRRRYRVRARKRGFLTFGPTRLESGDLFGLFKATRSMTTRDAVVVYPHIVPLTDFDLPSARPVGDALSPVRLFEDINRPNGLREYQSGDAIRRIDWKSTAKKRFPHVRTYDFTVEHHLMLIVDVVTVERPWEGYSSRLLERVVTATASVAKHADDLGYRIGMISNGIPLSGRGRMVLAPGSGPEQLPTILETLAMVRPLALGKIHEAAAAGAEAIPFGSTVVGISAVLPEHMMRMVMHLGDQGHPALAVYVGDKEIPFDTDRVPVRSLGSLFDVDEADERGV